MKQLKNISPKTFGIGLAAGIAIYFLALLGMEQIGLNAWLSSKGGPPRIEVKGVFPGDMELSLNYLPMRGKGKKQAKKFRKKNAVVVAVNGQNAPQIVQIPLPENKAFSHWRINFSRAQPDSTRHLDLDLEEIKEKRKQPTISQIGIINGDQNLQWSAQDIQKVFKHSKTMGKTKVVGQYFHFTIKKNRSFLEPKEPVPVAIGTIEEKQFHLPWLINLFAVLCSLLVILVLLRFNQKLAQIHLYHLAYCLLFFAMILFPHLDFEYSDLHFPGNNEKRKLAPKPELKLEKWADYPTGYEMYYKDHFGFRKPLIYLNSRFKVQGLGVSPYPDEVILGKENWLFKAEFLPDYAGRVPYTPEELKMIGEKFYGIQQWCAAQGVKYYLFLNPDKYTIYPEFLPDWVRKVNAERRLDQLAAYLKVNYSKLRFIDVREEMLAGKKIARNYNRNDLHWNAFGGFTAYEKLIGEIAKDFAAIAPMRLEKDYQVKQKLVFKGGLSKMLSMEEMYSEERPVLKPKQKPKAKKIKAKGFPPQTIIMETGNKKLPRAVVFRDSFFSNIMDPFSEHFDRIVMIKNANRKKADGLDKMLLEKEKPDILIHQMSEYNSLPLLDY